MSLIAESLLHRVRCHRYTNKRLFRALALFCILVLVIIWLQHYHISWMNKKLQSSKQLKKEDKQAAEEKTQAQKSDLYSGWGNEEELMTYIGEFLHVHMHCNTFDLMFTIVLNNTGTRPINFRGWSLYFSSVQGKIVETNITANELPYSCNMNIDHIDGNHHTLQIQHCKHAVAAGEKLSFDIAGFGFYSSATLPKGWYAATDDEGVTSGRLHNTIQFYNELLTPVQRFNWNYVPNYEVQPDRILPTPKRVQLKWDRTVDVSGWYACTESEEFAESVDNLVSVLGSGKYRIGYCPARETIRFVHDPAAALQNENEDESYTITINSDGIAIAASSKVGAFYAIQTIRSLTENNKASGSITYRIPIGTIQDKPRFSYRSVMIDVARNFISKNEIIKLIEVMASYKLNKLHLHLVDDEAWRLQIPGLPLLTSLAASRCHVTKDCLSPQHGSGPDRFSSGSGFYTVRDYQEILLAAKANHIEIIPEIDVPAHSKAAITAMNRRYELLSTKGDKERAVEFLLQLPDDAERFSSYSTQNFRNNVMNPCIESTYRFIEYVVEEMRKMHSQVGVDLKKLHLGGDEIPFVNYEEMESCRSIFEAEEDLQHTVHRYFFTRLITSFASKYDDMKVITWQEAANELNEPLEDAEMLVNVWRPLTEGKTREDVTFLADAGFKVILTMADVLYLDNRHEADSNEVGLAWASKFVDEEAVFAFAPDSVYARELNINGSGEGNVIGMQATLFGELINSNRIFHQQLFPRLLSFAERAWHKANWEYYEMNEEMSRDHKRDWEEFVNLIGYKELARLKNQGIKYRIPPPGVREIDDTILVTTLYPRLVVMYEVRCDDEWLTRDSCGKWNLYRFTDPPLKRRDYQPGQLINFVTVDGLRRSRVIPYRALIARE